MSFGVDIGNAAFVTVLDFGFGSVCGVAVELCELEFPKPRQEAQPRGFFLFLLSMGVLIGLEIGYIFLAPLPGSPSAPITFMFVCGGGLLGYLWRYRTLMDIQKHPERFTD